MVRLSSKIDGTTVGRAVALLLGSVCVGWHALSLAIGAGPGSDTMQRVYPLFEPYLEFLNLTNDWGFFSPDPPLGVLLRYRVTTHSGDAISFELTETHEHADPSFFRYTSMYDEIRTVPEDYEVEFIDWLCRRHADLEPDNIALVEAEQQIIEPKAFGRGHGILHGLVENPRPSVPCSAEAL